MNAAHTLAGEAGALLEAVRTRTPRVHCLTNSVVQKFTADGLSAIGAHPSMTGSAEEVADFATSADALLVNLGTLDPARRAGIDVALGAFRPTGRPWTLDPVHCDRSPARLAYARSLLALGPAVVRGNAAEMTLLDEAPAGTVLARTGSDDLLALGGRAIRIANGDPLMARVTGTGCLAGALVAAFLTVSTDRLTGASAALLFFSVAGEIAAETAKGPGSFAMALLDALANLTPADLLQRARVEDA